MTDRLVIAVSGADRLKFLDGLVTNALPSPGDGLRYAALLTPQGKYIADFFMMAEDERILLDAPAAIAPALAQRLGMYKLRADVTIEDSGLKVSRGTGEAPEGALPDPRHPAMGWRLYGTTEGDDGSDWDAIRVEAMVPEAGAELTGDSYPLEMGLDRLHGVDFRKGCYVGQEVTARMRHKTELKKGLARLRLSGPATAGAEILAGEKPAGTLHTVSGNRGLAWLRYDRATGPMLAGGVAAELDATLLDA
ncbi:YgfZ/GcvT domain-containing protein [Histidinibacterium lentulum]|uniref:Folate-binding protein n=1 Tax=Histidinibacterium lentulum TaxID=2480588 RepID=A0A3N2QS41_9RHOB|nr:folate-binding protein YgfZ [Histidinibacterium lentulum]ROT98031.1 folate-binding protein [Histidinibacterium lentulum]